MTLYTNAVTNASALGLTDSDQAIIKAAGIEEQVHHDFFALVSGKNQIPPYTFSFPNGAQTFSDLATFIETQQMLEAVFDSAFIAAVRELSHQGAHRAAQIACQVACIESEHRTLGRMIAAAHGITTLPKEFVVFNDDPPNPGLDTGILSPAPIHTPPAQVPTMPPDNWAFAPVFLEDVGDAPDLVKAAGFLSPTSGNSFSYHHIDFDDSTYAPGLRERLLPRTIDQPRRRQHHLRRRR